MNPVDISSTTKSTDELIAETGRLQKALTDLQSRQSVLHLEASRMAEKLSEVMAENVRLTKAYRIIQDALSDAAGKRIKFLEGLSPHNMKLGRDILDLENENTRLRAACAISKGACFHCSLPADEWAKCELGEENCERSLDALGCAALLELGMHQSQIEDTNDASDQ